MLSDLGCAEGPVTRSGANARRSSGGNSRAAAAAAAPAAVPGGAGKAATTAAATGAMGAAAGTRACRRKTRASADGAAGEAGAAPAAAGGAVEAERQKVVLLSDGEDGGCGSDRGEGGACYFGEGSPVNVCVEGVSGPGRLWFRLPPRTRCGRVFARYADAMGLDLAAVKFLHNGVRVVGHDTVQSLGMANGARVVVMPAAGGVGENEGAGGIGYTLS